MANNKMKNRNIRILSPIMRSLSAFQPFLPGFNSTLVGLRHHRFLFSLPARRTPIWDRSTFVQHHFLMAGVALRPSRQPVVEAGGCLSPDCRLGGIKRVTVEPRRIDMISPLVKSQLHVVTALHLFLFVLRHRVDLVHRAPCVLLVAHQPGFEFGGALGPFGIEFSDGVHFGPDLLGKGPVPVLRRSCLLVDAFKLSGLGKIKGGQHERNQ